MKAMITKVSTGWKLDEVKDFNTLQELINFQKEVSQPIIIDNHNEWFDKEYGIKENIDFDIEIYDDYRE